MDKIHKLSNLTTPGLSHNNLSIDLNFRDDRDLSPFPDIGYLMLVSSKLRGIPSFLTNQSILIYLEGPIPKWIWQLKYLSILNISKNFLTNLEGSV